MESPSGVPLGWSACRVELETRDFVQSRQEQLRRSADKDAR
jgi:hypothetical protein